MGLKIEKLEVVPRIGDIIETAKDSAGHDQKIIAIQADNKDKRQQNHSIDDKVLENLMLGIFINHRLIHMEGQNTVGRQD